MLYGIAIMLIVLHGLDGREITISVDEVTSLHGRVPGKANKLFTDGVNCIVNMSDGQSLSVVETCMDVRDAMLKSGRTP